MKWEILGTIGEVNFFEEDICKTATVEASQNTYMNIYKSNLNGLLYSGRESNDS